jgi:hypothetical protein
MRTLTAYGIGVIIVLAILNGIAWLVGTPRLHGLNVFSTPNRPIPLSDVRAKGSKCL